MSGEPRLDVAAREDLLALLPAAVAILDGPTHLFTFANDRYLALVNRDVVGMTVQEAIPEVVPQGFIAILDDVLRSAEPYFAHETVVHIARGEGAEAVPLWLNFAYLPIVDDDGAATGILVHAVEVSELVAARESARELAQTLETVFDRMPAGGVIAEAPSGRILRANRVFRRFFPVEPETTPTVEAWDAYAGRRADGTPYTPDDYPLARSLVTGEVVDGERIVFPTAAGDERTIEISSAPIRNAGEITSAVATFFDVTERDWSQRLLEDQNRVLELVATGAPLTQTLDALTTMVESRVPDAHASILLLSDDRRHLVHGSAPSLPDDYNAAVDGIAIGEAAGSCGTAAHRGERVVVTDIASDPLWEQWRDIALGHGLRACWSSPIRSRDGDVLGTFAVYYEEPRGPKELDVELVDIVNRTAAVAIGHARLYDAERRARAEAERRAQAAFALEQIDDGVALVDDGGRVGVWSRAAVAITGIPVENALGRRLDELIGGWDGATEQLRRETGRGSQTVPVEVRGRETWLEVGATRFDGGIVFAFRDVTAERRLDAIRNDLIATVSHELRTPVTAVFGAVRTLEREEVRNDESLSERLFDVVKSESTRLVGLVEEILLASNLDSGNVELDVHGVDALAVAEEAAASFAAAGAHVTASGARLRVAADRHRLLQVVDNLVDNALKYGGDGSVEVTVAEQASGVVCVLVADHGPGIPAPARNRVFEKFVRLDPDMRSGVNGTGLGLYIVRELVERMGGRVWVEPRRDGESGAVFVVALRPA